MFPPMKKKPQPMEAEPDMEMQGLDELKGFAEDGMVEEMLARLGLTPPGGEGDEEAGAEGMEASPEDANQPVPGMDEPENPEEAEAAPGLDPEKLKALLASMSSMK